MAEKTWKDSEMRVGVIGLGAMGMGAAKSCLAAGLETVGCDLSPAARAEFEAAGGVVTNWRGGSCDEGGQVLAAGSAALHAEALSLLAAYAD